MLAWTKARIAVAAVAAVLLAGGVGASVLTRLMAQATPPAPTTAASAPSAPDATPTPPPTLERLAAVRTITQTYVHHKADGGVLIRREQRYDRDRGLEYARKVLATETLTRKSLSDADHQKLVEEALAEVDFGALAGDQNGNGR